MLITAKSQRVNKVLDSSYVPTKAEEELFHLHCDFMLSLFAMVFQTDKSKSILKHHVALDLPTAAQDIWHELQEYFCGSTTGKNQVDQHRNYCSSTCINYGKWNGNMHSIIFHLQQQVRNCNKLSKVHFTKEEKMQCLQQAVQPLPDLCAIKGTAETLFKALKKPLSCNDCFNLLSSSARTCDLEQSKPDPRTLRRSTLHVCQHDFDAFDTTNTDSFCDTTDHCDNDDNPFEFPDDININLHSIDTPVFELHAAQQLDPSTQMPKPIHQQLDSASKPAWIALPDALKHHLVKCLPASSSTPLSTNARQPVQRTHQPRPPFGQGNSHRTVHFTDTDTTPSTCSNTTNLSFDSFVDAFKAFCHDR